MTDDISLEEEDRRLEEVAKQLKDLADRVEQPIRSIGVVPNTLNLPTHHSTHVMRGSLGMNTGVRSESRLSQPPRLIIKYKGKPKKVGYAG